MNHTKSRFKPHGLMLAAALASSIICSQSQAAIVSNPGFQFTAPGHNNGDSGHATNLTNSNTPFWQPATTSGGFAPNISDPQGIFANNLNEYLQIQINSSPGGTQDAIQQIVIPSSGQYLLSMDADRRSDNLNTNGTMILELWSGNVTSFASGSPITPNVLVSPTLTGSFQQYSRTYNSLAPGNYTVRVGGIYNGPGSFFQAGIDNVNMVAVPEPSTCILIAVGAGLMLLRKRRSL